MSAMDCERCGIALANVANPSKRFCSRGCKESAHHASRPSLQRLEANRVRAWRRQGLARALNRDAHLTPEEKQARRAVPKPPKFRKSRGCYVCGRTDAALVFVSGGRFLCSESCRAHYNHWRWKLIARPARLSFPVLVVCAACGEWFVNESRQPLRFHPRGVRSQVHLTYRYRRQRRHGHQALGSSMRKRVLLEEPTCRGCGSPSKEVDHIVAVAASGSDDRANLQALCRGCHRTKTNDERRCAMAGGI